MGYVIKLVKRTGFRIKCLTPLQNLETSQRCEFAFVVIFKATLRKTAHPSSRIGIISQRLTHRSGKRMVAYTEGQVSVTQFEIKRPTITNFSSNLNRDSRRDGMFIDINIHRVETYALLDSGSTITVMHRSIFENKRTMMVLYRSPEY